MELNKAIEILKERVDTNKIILNDLLYESDFDKFVRVENEAIETVLEYIEESNNSYDYRAELVKLKTRYLNKIEWFKDNINETNKQFNQGSIDRLEGCIYDIEDMICYVPM